MQTTSFRSTIEYNGKMFPAIELFNFKTADGYNIDYGVFTSEDFENASDNSLNYRIIDDRVYGYLPNELITKGTEQEIREFIQNNIG